MIKIHIIFMIMLLIEQLHFKYNTYALEICVDDKSEVVYRLSNNTIPLNYEININTNLENDNFIFNGTTIITIIIQNTTKYIFLHSQAAKIKKIELISIDENNQLIEIKNCTFNLITDILKIESLDDLKKDKTYNLSITYSSYLRDDNLGFYSSSYINENGTKVWLAATQFAPTQARHAFPSFDEPRFKSTFKLHITHPNTTVALSNTNVENSFENDNGTITTIFSKTPKMSTYLVGFVISDFKCTTKNLPKIKQQMCGRSNLLKILEYAELFGSKILPKFQDYFNIALPIENMKHIALPDFYFGGMENWGITTYRESRIAFNATQHGSNEKISLVTLMGHEMAHNWFGNLVTMRWWTYVWLKEGFSTLYQYYGPNMILPEWKMMQYFISRNLQYVFQIDGEFNIRPMSYYVEKQTDIMANYDRIAYEKSACVLRMIDHIIGQDNFKKAVDEFLARYQLSSVEENDFIKIIEKFTNIPNISQIIKTWTNQGGYPVVTVTRNYNTSLITLTQERFLNYGYDDKNTIWHIPINFETSKNINNKFEITKPEFWLTKKLNTLNFENNKLDSDDWLIANIQQTGYYRVNYDLNNWSLLIKALIQNHSTIHVLNRAQLIDDAFNLANTGNLDFSIAFELINFLKNETEYAPWAAFDRSMSIIQKYLSENIYRNLLIKILKPKIIEPAFKYFNVSKINTTIPLQVMTQNIILKYACAVEIKSCLNESFNSNPDIRTLYFCNGLRSNTNKRFIQKKLEYYLRTNDDTVLRSYIINSIGCSTDQEYLRLFILYSIQDRSILKLSSNERLSIISSIYQQSNIGLNLVLEFLYNDWRKVLQLFPNNSLKNIVSNAAKYIKNQDTSDLLLKVISKININNDIRDEVLDYITRNLEKKLKYENEIELWIEKQQKTNNTIKIKSNIITVFILYFLSVYFKIM